MVHRSYPFEILIKIQRLFLYFPEYYLKRKNASLYILGTVWGHTLLFTGLPLVGWSRYQQEAFGTSCTIAWDDNRPAELAYNIVIIIACYCVHVVIFIFCYYKIINEFSSAKRCLARLREEVITDRETLRLELMLKYHKVMTYRKVTVVSLSIYVCIHIYVCLYVCRYLCMYVCMYV